MSKQKSRVVDLSEFGGAPLKESPASRVVDLSEFSQKKNPNEPINPSQNDMASSGATPSTDTKEEAAGWLEGAYNTLTGIAKSIPDAALFVGKGLLRNASKSYQGHSGGVPMSLISEAVNGKEAGAQMQEIEKASQENALKGADQLVPLERQKIAKGTSSISEIIKKGYITAGDAENIGYQIGDGLVQMGIGAIPGVGGMLMYSKNLESRYEDAKAKGFSDEKAYNESAFGALVETVIEKNIGVDKWISKGFGKQLSKEAIKDISGALVSKEAFEAVAKKYAKAFSLDNLKEGFIKGFLPEAAEEFAQTYIDGAEQDLFDYYERKKKQGDPNAKLELYDSKDEEGVFNTVNPKTGEAELTFAPKSKTLFGALDAAFYGGITGQMGGMFVDSRSFNPSIYSTLQNAYDSQGKQGLNDSIAKLKSGLDKASQDGKLDVESYNNALKNVDKIANNVAKFEQKSDVDSYSRWVLYDHTERVIPNTAKSIAKTLAEATTPMELPTEDQINDNVKNNEITVIPFERENQVPEVYKPYLKKDESGNNTLEASVPNSVVEAYNSNQAAIQTAMNNPMFAIDSLTNNNQQVTIEDLKRIGQQGGIQGDLASQLNFNIVFEANKNNFQRQLRVINYAKSISNNIVNGNKAESADLRKGYANIFAFNTGDTVFYNNKSAKVMEISPDGQKLKLSGVQEQVSANDDNLKLQDAETEQALQPTVEPTAQQEAPAQEAPIAETTQEKKPELPEEEQITGRTMRDAVGELIPFTFDGETGEIYTTNSGVVTFESPNKVVEFGNIKDVGDMSIDSFGIVPQEMSIGNDYSVTIDGKTFTNKNQNPFKAFTYDADGNVVSAKLENDKGQTRVIKGTRAVVIEAKYKVKKLYDESTREQLAAAAEDAAQQAAAIEDTRGQSTEVATPTESKPVEQAPTIAERESAKRVREIAERLAAEETEQMTQNRQAVANLASSLFTAGVNVQVMNAEQIRIKYGKNVEQGMFIAKDGTIVLNESILPSEWGKTIIFHEGTHPIINIIRNTEPKLYKQLVDAIKEEAKFNPEVNKILQQINSSDEYKDEFTRNDELVVESIARIASGKMNLNNVKPTLRQAIVDFINKIAKSMGFKQVLKDSNQVAFKKLANQISSALNEGRDISEIVGAKNVGKFNTSDSGFVDSEGNSLTNGDVQFSAFNRITNKETGFSYQYFKDSNDFNKLVNDNAITNDKVLKDFEGKHFVFHAPDNAFSGDLIKDGKVVVKGQGGIFYPMLNYANKLMWASTEKASDFVKYLRENAKLNNGSIYFGLVSTDPNKLLSSTTASVGVMDLFLEKAKDKSFDISEANIKKHLINAFKGTTILKDKKGDKIIKFDNIDKDKLSGNLDSVRDYIESRLSPDNSSFDDRKYFAHRFLRNIAKDVKDYSSLANQLGEFFHIKMENEAFKGKYKAGYKISGQNLIDNVAHIFSEPLLKGQETGGKVYAVIEVSPKSNVDVSDVDLNNIVSSIKSDSHKSYPNAIKINDDRYELKIHILQDRQEWFNNSVSLKTNKIVGKTKSTSVMPTTAGITMGSVKLEAQMSSIDRSERIYPNGKPSNLNEYQYNAVRTPEFKAWFGDWENDPENASKIVDENGEPMVVYTGTSKDKDFDKFNIPKNGAWFTSDPKEASMYAEQNDSQKTKMEVVGGDFKFTDINTTPRVIPVFLNIRNSVDFKTTDLVTDKQRESLRYADNYKKLQGILFQNIFYSKSVDERRAGDFIDGINYAEGVYVVLKDPTQIKSAIGSKFSPTNPKIQMSAINRDLTASQKEQLINDVQFSDLSRDDKRIQTIRRDFSTYPKADIVKALMGEPFNLPKEKAEDLVKRAFADPLAPSLPTGNPSTAIPEGSRVNEPSTTVEEYNVGYKKYKKAILDTSASLWNKAMRAIALEYDSRFFVRRSLGMTMSGESLAKAQLRNLNGIAYSASQELAQLYEDIFGNGLSESGIETLDAMIFNLRILQIDRNTENQVQDLIEKLTTEFMDTMGRMPTDAESLSLVNQARKTIPTKLHGLTKNGEAATSMTAQQFLDDLRAELGENEFNMLKARADMFKKVGNEQVEKLRKAGIISNDVAASYKDDFYAFRMTLDRLYGKEDPSIVMLNGVPAIKGWSALSKEGTSNYISQDARLMLAQSYIGTARVIAKNALRESIFNENINVDKNGNQESARMLNGERVTFVKPAIYIRDENGNIRSNGKELSVRDAQDGYVNVPFKKDGVINYFQMEKEMFEQLEGNNIKWNDAELSGAISRAYYWTSDLANRILTGFATRRNPFFWIGNVPMDLQQQVFFTDIWTDGNMLESNVYSAGARAFARTIKFSDFFGMNKEYVDKTLQEYIAAGGAMDKMSSMAEQRQRSINVEIVTDTKGNTLKQILNKVKSGTSKGVSYMNEKTEIAMRLAAYDQSKKNLIKKFEEDNNGAKPNEAQMLKIQEIAAAKSRAYTDFAQRGTSLPNANIAYLNSSIQAAGAAAEYIYDNPAKASAKIGQLVVGKFVGTMAIMALMGDAYDELDEYRKDLYSFLYSFDTGKKDKDGNPIFVTADVRNNPSLVPVLGVTRRMAESVMRTLQGKEPEKKTVGGTIDEFVTLLNQAIPIPIPNITSIDGLKKSALQLVTKHTIANAAIKGMMGYDAFRNKDIVAEKDKDLSPYMQGQDDPSIPYFYKAIARSMSSFSSKNQVSPATMQSVTETFLTSPRTNPITGLAYMVLSDAANAVIPAKTEAERGGYSFADGSKIIKSITGRFATFTDAKKADFRKNEELYIQSKEESMKFNDTERIIDNQLKDLKDKAPSTFFSEVDKLIKDEGYDENLALVGRIKAKAANIYKKDFRKSMVDEGIMNEVRILHYTQGAEGKAKLMNYMFEGDKQKADEVFNSLIYYGSSPAEVFEAKKMYNQMVK